MVGVAAIYVEWDGLIPGWNLSYLRGCFVAHHQNLQEFFVVGVHWEKDCFGGLEASLSS